MNSRELTSEYFLSSISHEIRTPLNGILGYLQLLNNTNLTDVQRCYTDNMYRCSVQLLEIVNDILDFSKLSSGKVSVNNSYFSIKDMIMDIQSVVELKLREKNQKITFIVDDKLPDYITTDRQKLTQILINLVTNSIKFTPIQGRIIVNIFKFEDSLQISVEDNGVGISLEHQKMLFQPFYQVEKGTKGFGLGLAICKHLVTLLGGEINIDSEINYGTIINFTVKYEDGQVYEQYINSKKQILHNKYILVCDDILDDRIILSELLFEYNMKPIICATLKEAEKILSTNRYHFSLVICNLSLDNISEFIKKNINYPIIGLTNNTGIIYKNVEKIINKPINNTILLNNLIDIVLKSESNAIQLNPVDKNIKILIAEDVSYNLDMLVKMLNSLKYDNITTSTDGEQTIQKLSENTYDILLLDLVMPKIDGFQVAEYIKNRGLTRPKIVAVTSCTTDSDKDRCRELGISYFLIKPFNINTLKSIIKKLS